MPTAGIQHPAAGRTAHCCATSNSAAVRVDNGNAVAGSNGINQPPRLLSLISPNFRENAGRAAGHLVRDFDTEKRPVKSRIVPKSHYRLALHPSRTWTIRPAYLEGSPVARHENISPQPKGVCIFGHRHLSLAKTSSVTNPLKFWALCAGPRGFRGLRPGVGRRVTAVFGSRFPDPDSRRSRYGFSVRNCDVARGNLRVEHGSSRNPTVLVGYPR